MRGVKTSQRDREAVRDLVTMRDAASMLGVSTPKGALQKLRRLGARVVVDGKRFLVPRSEIEEALASRLVPLASTSSLKSPLRKSA